MIALENNKQDIFDLLLSLDSIDYNAQSVHIYI